MTQPPEPNAVPAAERHPVEFPEGLPISARVVDIAKAIDAHPVVVVAGETGSGKTTQLPKVCLAMGRGVGAFIGCTQPRRIAATSVAARVASELKTTLGNEVGYKIRFDEAVRPTTYVKFMTDGILLAEAQGDPLLRAYDTIILDEAHERSLNVDFLLGYLKRLLPRRPDLKVIISSATLETERFAAFFGGAPVVKVSGRTYPVEVIYRPVEGDEIDLAEAVAEAVDDLAGIDPRGDTLVFLPGEREIREAEAALVERALPHTTILPLYGRLSGADQARVFQPGVGRRVVLATNVAETSLTIPGIVFVVDTGLARVNRYDPRTGVTRLQVEAVSRASADQRKGRCGRTSNGVCVRLYAQDDFERRPEYTDPEVKRTGLAGVILRMKSLGLGDIEDFPFLDTPPSRAVGEGYRVLDELGALDAARGLTAIGRDLARFPADPRVARMVLGGVEQGALAEALVVAAALCVQDPRERPSTARQAADEAHRKFKDESSDFVAYLNLWRFYQDASAHATKAKLRKVCRDKFLSFNRMSEWRDVHRQLADIARESGAKPAGEPATYEQVHRALLPGLLSRVGVYKPEQRAYTGARQTRFALHPGSGLSKKPPPWVVAAELVETTQLFARVAARVEPEWVEQAAGPLAKKSYADPHWEQKPAQVVASEQVTVFGLPVAKQRRVHYGPHDAAAARRIFLEHALVRGEYQTRGAFMAHNRAVLAEAASLRSKARRSDLVADEDALTLFFEARVPDGVYSGKAFEDWRAVAEAERPNLLRMGLDDVLLDEARDLTPARYPDALALYGTSLPLDYRFDPSADDDGITVNVPLVVLPQAEAGVFEWTIPGWLPEKISLLLHGLPKAVRKHFGPIGELTDALVAGLRPGEAPMLPALADAITALTGARIDPNDFRLDELPPYLRFTYRVVDEGGKVLASGRDLDDLRTRFGARAKRAFDDLAAVSWRRDGITTWNFGPLPDRVEVDVGGRRALAYPALVDAETSVGLRLLESPSVAREATREGLRRLYLLHTRTTPARLEQQVPTSLGTGALAATTSGAPPVRRQVALRAVDEVFGLGAGVEFPRSAEAFAARASEGARDLPLTLAAIAKAAADVEGELAKTNLALKACAASHAPKESLDDVRGQIARLVPPSLVLTTHVARLRQLPRYLKAVQVRLQRLPNDPIKDREKESIVRPFWQNYLRYEQGPPARTDKADEREAYRWLIEEFRVSVFAPELKAAVPVSAQRLAEQWARLTAK